MKMHLANETIQTIQQSSPYLEALPSNDGGALLSLAHSSLYID